MEGLFFMSVKQKIKEVLPADAVKIISAIYQKINLRNWYAVYFGRVRIGFLVVSVGQACNFKCRDCANFAPASPDRFKRYDIKDIKKDLEVLFENIRYIKQLQIQGGEPFLYSDLAELVDFLHENREKVHEVVIATNGSLIPSDSLLKCLKRNDVCVRISDYGIVGESCSRLMEKLRQNDIRSYLYSFVSKKSLWYDCGSKNIPRGGMKEARKRFCLCDFRGCLTLERGELSYCSRATNSYVIQGFLRKTTDYFNLRETKRNFRTKLAKYLVFRHPMQACRYCNGTNHNHMIPPAIQM